MVKISWQNLCPKKVEEEAMAGGQGQTYIWCQAAPQMTQMTRLSNGCCIFWPAFGVGVLVKISFFMFFSRFVITLMQKWRKWAKNKHLFLPFYQFCINNLQIIWKSRYQPAFLVHSTKMLIKIYNKWLNVTKPIK